jgi:GNAT superfamily N-acetyltransferase
MQSEIVVRRVNSIHDAAFDQLVEIYTEAISQGGRKSLERLAEMIQHPSYFFLVGLQSDRVIGFAILRAFDASDAALLEYLAVERSCRSHGVGSALLQSIANLDAFSSNFLLAEVDSDKNASTERSENTRRKQFYRRLGWKEVDQLSYIMPPVSNVQPPAMDMLVFKSRLPSHIDRDRIRQWLQHCYVDVYHQPATDSRINTMMNALPQKVALV